MSPNTVNTVHSNLICNIFLYTTYNCQQNPYKHSNLALNYIYLMNILDIVQKHCLYTYHWGIPINIHKLFLKILNRNIILFDIRNSLNQDLI